MSKVNMSTINFFHLRLFIIWTFNNLWPLTTGRVERWPLTFIDVFPRQTCCHTFFCQMRLFVVWPFFDFCLLNRRVNEEVIVDIFWLLPKTNMLRLLFLRPFKVVYTSTLKIGMWLQMTTNWLETPKPL